MKNLVKRFAANESGATAIEYGLIASLIAVAIIVCGRRPRQQGEQHLQQGQQLASVIVAGVRRHTSPTVSVATRFRGSPTFCGKRRLDGLPPGRSILPPGFPRLAAFTGRRQR